MWQSVTWTLILRSRWETVLKISLYMQTLSKCLPVPSAQYDISLSQLEKFRFRRDTSNHAIVMKVRKWNVTILIFSIQRLTVRVTLLCVTNFLKTLKTSRSWETPCQSISPGEKVMGFREYVLWVVTVLCTLCQGVVYTILGDHDNQSNNRQVCCLHKQAGELRWTSELPHVLHLFIAEVYLLLIADIHKLQKIIIR